MQEAGVDLEHAPERAALREGKMHYARERTETPTNSAPARPDVHEAPRIAVLARKSMPNGFSPRRCLPARTMAG